MALRSIMENILSGKTVLITGANTGIGKETARALLKQGARVIIACRNIEKAEEARKDLLNDIQDGKIDIVTLNLASLKSVRECVVTLMSKGEKINYLINNAGVMACPYSKTEDGLEMQFGVNHVGHFLLTKLLLPNLIENSPSRIITVASHAHYMGNINFDDINSEKSYGPFKAYAQSKLANVLFSKELSKRLEGTNVNTYALHPGVVNTELGRHLHNEDEPLSWRRKTFRSMLKTSEQGAYTSIYCAITPSLAGQTGWYYSGGRRTITSIFVWWNDKMAKRLWDITEKIVEPFSQPIEIKEEKST